MGRYSTVTDKELDRVNRKPLWALLCTVLLSMCIAAAEDAVDKVQGKASWDRLLVAGYRLDKIMIMNRSGKVLWSMETTDRSSDAWMLDNGNIIYSCKQNGTKIVKPDYESGQGGEMVWHRPVPAGCETHACQPLGDGKFLIGESYEGVSYVLEVDTEGKEHKRIELKGLGDAHGTWRVIRKTPQGTYLIVAPGQGELTRQAVEIDSEGNVIRRFPGGAWLAVRLPNGNTLLSSGGPHWGGKGPKILEVDPAGEIVWKLENKDLPEGVKLGFTCGVQRLPGGNTLICNGKYGMGPDGDPGPAIFEITRDKKVAWTWDAAPKNYVTSVMVLDEKTRKQGSWR
jgi:hypothetical protein